MNSPIKWVGGKRREIKIFEKYIPNFKTYVEPFVGGGALYWNLNPSNARLNDINEELVNFYNVLRESPNELQSMLNEMVLSKEYFDGVVLKLNSKDYKDNVERASIFYYLNKTAFSGKWRVNKKGNFNSSYGYYKTENFKKIDLNCGKILSNTIITCENFIDTMEEFQFNSDAFIFCDPPYMDCDSFYTPNQEFSDIYEYLKVYMDNCKSKVMIVVKENEFLRELFKGMIVDEYEIKYTHNTNSNKINKHIVITNYII